MLPSEREHCFATWVSPEQEGIEEFLLNLPLPTDSDGALVEQKVAAKLYELELSRCELEEKLEEWWVRRFLVAIAQSTVHMSLFFHQPRHHITTLHFTMHEWPIHSWCSVHVATELRGLAEQQKQDIVQLQLNLKAEREQNSATSTQLPAVAARAAALTASMMKGNTAAASGTPNSAQTVTLEQVRLSAVKSAIHRIVSASTTPQAMSVSTNTTGMKPAEGHVWPASINRAFTEQGAQFQVCQRA